MRHRIADVVVISLAVAGLTALAQSTSYADPECQVTDPESGVCLVWATAPAPDPTPVPSTEPADTGQGHACYWDPTKQGISKPPAGPVPCKTNYGYWSNTYNCYISLADPQPPAGDPSWQGHEPGDGAIYDCYQPQTDMFISVWAQEPPPSSGAGPTPREVAEIAVDQMDLRAIDIGIVPEPGAGSIGLVGMPVWMWAANPDSHTFGPNTASASAGGITITATARVHQITWDVGDGTTVTCSGAGTPYRASYGDQASPDCGHVYQRSSAGQPHEKYTVTATSDWVIDWAGAGQAGTIQLNGLTRSVQVAVGEAQVLVQ